MAPRSIWNGTITFGLVNVPIKLYTATESKTVSFNEVHAKDGARIEHRRICSKEGKEVDYDEIVKGYEVSENTYVVLEKDEVKAAAGERGKVVHLEEFVDASEIDPVFHDKTYYVGSREAEDAYRLLHEAAARRGVGRTERVALGRFVMRTKEYLAAVRAREGALLLTTMRFHDEVRPTQPIPTGGKKPGKKQLDSAVALIEALATDWEPTRYEDCYRERLGRVIESKRKRRKIEAPKPEKEPAPVPDLMDALQRAIDNVRAGRNVRAEPEDGDGELDGLSRDELYERAQAEQIPGRTKMSKKELVKALTEAGR